MAFRGTYHHTLDAKNRLTVPARFRDEFADGSLVIAKGLDPCVELWHSDDYAQHVEDATAHYPTTSPEKRQILRLMQGSAFDTALDKVGRVGLTAELIEHGALAKDVVLIGVGRCLELWDRARWEQQDAGLSTTVGTFTAQHAALTTVAPGAGA